MYIKVKHIKQFILISACIFFAGFNYLTYVKADNANLAALDTDKDGLTDEEEKLYGTVISNSDSDGDGYSDGVEVKSGYDPTKPAPGDRIVSGTTSQLQANNATTIESSATEEFSTEFKSFLDSKGDEPITTDDIKGFVETEISSKMGDQITFETLPEIDTAQIKVLKQDYAHLSEANKKAALRKDFNKYLEQVLYLLISNSPNTISSKSDLATQNEEFFRHMSDLSSPNADLTYFKDLGNRVEITIPQMNNIEVPETMIDLHVKFLRLAKGLLTLRDVPNNNNNDPLGRMLVLAKAKDFIALYSDFFTIAFQDYLKTLSD
ncbi:MAG: hypothetical protein ACD_9C00289G0002 [uncultured bacterium]|nr:MAG: hypothetical protein ACD_9C00289G0002 [uncultured bacterium]